MTPEHKGSHNLVVGWGIAGALIGAVGGYMAGDLGFAHAMPDGKGRALETAVGAATGAAMAASSAYLGHQGINPLLVGGGQAIAAAEMRLLTGGMDAVPGAAAAATIIGGATGLIAYASKPQHVPALVSKAARAA